MYRYVYYVYLLCTYVNLYVRMYHVYVCNMQQRVHFHIHIRQPLWVVNQEPRAARTAHGEWRATVPARNLFYNYFPQITVDLERENI